MKDQGPEIRRLARSGMVKYTVHAIQRIREYDLTILQVQEMLKNCRHNQRLDDTKGHRVEGRTPATSSMGTRNISAHVHVSDKILVITVINN